MSLSEKTPEKGYRTLTWSVMRKWMDCPRKWYYRYVGGFDTLPGQPLIFGTLFHSMLEAEAMDNIEKESMWESEVKSRREDFDFYWSKKRDYLIPVVDEWCREHNRVIDDAILSQGAIAPPKYTFEDIQTMADLALDMMYYWTFLHGADDLAQHRFVSTEFKFRDLPLLDDFGDPVTGWKANGMVDVLLQDRVTGEYIVRDYKTTGMSNAKDFSIKAGEMDAQTHFYVSNLEQVYDIRISRIQYAVFRKKVPSLPKWVKKRPRTKDEYVRDGKEPGIKSNMDTTRDVLLGWLDAHDIPESIIDGKPFHEWSRFLYVHDFEVEEEEIHRVRSESEMAAKGMESAIALYFKSNDQNRAFPRNTSNCCSAQGYCQYKTVCSKNIKAEEVSMGLFYRRVSDHPELEEEKENEKP